VQTQNRYTVKTFKFISSLAVVLLFSTILSSVIAPNLDLPMGAVFGTLTALSLIPTPKGVAFMAIQKEIWLGDIVGNLFKSNPHLGYAMNADEFVLNGKVVHIPNAGSKPGVQKNRTKLPATVIKRNDVDITFSLDEFTSDPMRIDNAEKYELSYDLRNSIIGEQKSAIAELVGDWFFRYWAPTLATAMRRTTGANVATHYGTGTRKLVTLDDIKAIQKMMNNWNIPQEGRVAVLDAEMMDQFTSTLNATTYRDFSAAYDAQRGVIGKLYGFDFLDPRSSVLRYSADTTPVPYDPDDAVASTDFAAGLFWQKDLVIRAMGQHELFESTGDPTVYGDIYSALMRAGGRIKRNDGKGVIALVQAVGA
jgi:P22 coat protein - gene protein 5.